MPIIEFEPSISSVTGSTTSTRPHVNTRMENSTVHAEPPGLTNNMNPNFESRVSNQNPSIPSQLPFLRKSLRPITLKFEDLAYNINLQSGKDRCLFTSADSKRTRTVLNGVSGVVRPGELLAMLGPSGSGKTTLLAALGGRLSGKLSGSITYSGQTFSSSVKRKIGFVTQDDVLYPHLTVLETLTYAAMLRLPKSLTHEEKAEQAELIILELGLTRCRDSIVGGPLIRGVSGGERKRVSIGQEMLVNPSLLLLDEPTSGLDSTTALRLMATLNGLARGGRSVVTTIHQPSSRLYWMFDKVLVLSDGSPIYYGCSRQVMEYLASIGYVPGFNLMNPADFLLDLANGVVPSTNPDDHQDYRQDSHEEGKSVKQFLISSYKKSLYPLIKEDINREINDATRAIRGPQSPNCCDSRWTTSWWTQFKVLFKRGVRERRHESYSGLRIFQVMSVSILSGLLWWHSDTSHLQDQVPGLSFIVFR
ncbi:putative ABC transporter, AAA+ ATPase domain, P-loop containing nucleoside triphosphate hydrolase [Helianthus debilis subsp. tardiflorus]